jgi:uncharacterized protein (UPF0548 family)
VLQIARGRSTAAAERLLMRSGSLRPTFDPAVHTTEGLPVLTVRTDLGAGADVLDRTAEFVLGWGLQRGAGLLVTADRPRAEAGRDVVVGVPAGPLMMLAPCRVVEVVDEPDRRGFSYVTLPGHPERGIEHFLARRCEDGRVELTVQAFAGPGTPLVRLGWPVGRLLQRFYTGRYLGAARAGVSGDASSTARRERGRDRPR